MAASPVIWRICAAISVRKAAFEKAQGAATAVIATRMARPAKMKIISDRSLRDGGEGPETTVADSTIALRLPLMGLRNAKTLSGEDDAASVQKIQGQFRKCRESKSRILRSFREPGNTLAKGVIWSSTMSRARRKRAILRANGLASPISTTADRSILSRAGIASTGAARANPIVAAKRPRLHGPGAGILVAWHAGR
jgi:hypothetical protein